MKRMIICFLLVFAVLVMSSCSVAENIETKPSAQGQSSLESSSGTDIASSSVPVVATQSGGTLPSGVSSDNSQVDAASVFALYKAAAQRVKDNRTAFTLAQKQDFSDITTGEPTGIANMVLKIVSESLLVKANTQTHRVTSSAVISEFPVCNKDYATDVADSSVFSAAYARRYSSTSTEYTLCFADALNPVAGMTGFGGIMVPFDREIIVNSISDYGMVVDRSTLRLDCNYKDCRMVFRLSDSGELEDIQQYYNVYIDGAAEINIAGIKTNFLNGTCLYTYTLSFTDFDK